jgi:predicted DCC family thiol-disulfide oxidoreductase YuxK
VQRAPYEYRADPAVPSFADDRPVIVFDGKCELCSSFAQFILRKDRHARFRLLAAQSELGSALYRHLGLDPVSYETYVLLQDGKAYFRSEASIRIVDGLGGGMVAFCDTCPACPRVASRCAV